MMKLVQCPDGCSDSTHEHYEFQAEVSLVPVEKEEIEAKETDNKDELYKTITLTKQFVNSKQIAYGVVIDPYSVDAHGDYVPPVEVERAAHAWMAKQVLGKQHAVEDLNAQLVESYLVPYPSVQDYEAAMVNQDHRVLRMPYGDQHLHSGSWVIGVKFSDDRWEQIQKGEVTGYSYGGFGMRRASTPIDKPTPTFVDLPV